MTYDEFIELEERNRDVIIINKLYIDILGGDLIAGLLLSKIVYWNLPSKQGVVRRSGDYLVKQRSDWYDEVRITPKQYDRAAAVLKKSGLIDWHIECSNFHNGKTVPFIALNTNVLMKKINEYLKATELPKGENGTTELPKGQNALSPKVKTPFPQRSKPSITQIIDTDYIHGCTPPADNVVPILLNSKTALHNKIKADFAAANDYYHDGREAKAINNIIDRALYAVKDVPEDERYKAAYDAIRERAAILYKLLKNPPSDFFARLSFVPHVLQIVWNDLRPDMVNAHKKGKFEASLNPDIIKKLMEA